MLNIGMAITYSKSNDQPGKLANPARGQLNRDNECFPVSVRCICVVVFSVQDGDDDEDEDIDWENNHDHGEGVWTKVAPAGLVEEEEDDDDEHFEYTNERRVRGLTDTKYSMDVWSHI